MTSTQTAIWNLLKRGRRGALRVSLLGQSLLLLAAACGGGDDTTGGTTTTGTPNTGTTTSPGTGAAGSTAKPGGAATAGSPAAGGSTTTTGVKPGGTAGTTATTTPTTAGAAGASGGPATSTATSGSAGAGGKSATGSAGAAGSAQPDTGSTPTASGDGPLTGDAKCLADITAFDKPGPFMVKMEREGSVNFWVPSVPEGCKVPVIHLANGTGASCSSYQEALNHFATHGFLACCYEDANTGAGTQGLEALKTAMTKYPNLAGKQYGSTGHSQGGQSAFVVQALAEKEFGLEGNKFAGLAMEPASGFGTQPAMGWQAQYKSIKSPMFMFSGQGTDGLVSEGWVMDAFNEMDKATEAYHWSRNGATHIPVPNGEEMQIGPAWFRWKLLDDQAACKYFKSIPMTDTTWKEDASQNVQDCK